MAIAGAPSARANTSPSDVEAQKFVERPTTALRQTEPLGAGVSLTRTPSCSKYLSCSATQTAANAKLGTAVSIVTSGSSFCCALDSGVIPATSIKTSAVITTTKVVRFRIRDLLLCLNLNVFGLRLPA